MAGSGARLLPGSAGGNSAAKLLGGWWCLVRGEEFGAEAQIPDKAYPSLVTSILARLATQALENPALRNSVVELGMQAPPGSNQKKTPAVSSRSRARLILLDKDV